MSNIYQNLDTPEDVQEAITRDILKDRFPYAGFLDLLKYVQRRVEANRGAIVLDLGAGTGILAERFYSSGHQVTTIDQSPRMIEIERDRMRRARLICHDLKEGMPSELAGEKFDAIVSTYMISDFSDEELIKLINELLGYLAPEGKIYLGDTMFRTAELRDECRKENESKWDPAKNYIAFEDFAAKSGIPMTFQRVSYCAGIIIIEA